MAEWIYFLHTPRENFIETMTDEEKAAWTEHVGWLRQLLDDGTLILAGPTLGPINTGIGVYEAPDEDAARKIMNSDPTIIGGFATGELRPFRAAFLRGRD